MTRFSPDEVDALFEDAGWEVALEQDAPLRFQGQLGVLIAGEPDAVALRYLEP